MCLSLVPTLLWGYWANIIYIIGMIGYLTIDIISYMYISLNNTISCVIYIFLAIVFVIDAVFYTIDWYMYAVKLRKNQTEPIQYQFELLSCIFQNLGSYFYLIVFNLIGIISFLIESIFTLLGWIIVYRRKSSNNSKNSCRIQNISIWAHILNIIANFIYLCSVILSYYFYQRQEIIDSNTVLIVQIFGDFVYLFDAYLYHEYWQCDKQEFDVNTEQKKFYLKKLVENK